MLDNIKWLGHSTLKFCTKEIIYIDPYNLKDGNNDAQYIFITHSHYDHFSVDDIKKCMNVNTKIIITSDLVDKCKSLGFDDSRILVVKPNNNYMIDNISFSTIPAYNTNKQFHPKENDWVGYILTINSKSYYIAGDTDITNENKKVKCDVAFLPIGGTYTMTYMEASDLANIIKPKVVVPIHYGLIVGTKEDAIEFQKLLDVDVKCDFLD